MLRPDRSDSLIDYCIGLEALFGDSSRSETTHKLAIRSAAAIRADDPEMAAMDLFRAVKAVYDVRSDVVHGRRPKRPNVNIGTAGEMSATDAALLLLRRSLLAVIPKPILWEPAKIDEVLVLGSLGHMPDSMSKSREEE